MLGVSILYLLEQAPPATEDRSYASPFRRRTGDRGHNGAKVPNRLGLFGLPSSVFGLSRSDLYINWYGGSFSARKANMTFFIDGNFDGAENPYKKLGKHKKICCLSINKLDDVYLEVLQDIIAREYKTAST